ncbi:MAG TPA: alpha/beta fold hydrolase [Verrucomicrobiae bacterium]|nr:alpha/beta fold hydrolase [Verrucomicrobiae bacterium]
MTNPPPGAQGLPPLIDRELLFGNPEITSAQLSPDGRYIAFLKPWRDTMNIWVKEAAEPFGAARLLTTEMKRPIPAYMWTRDGKFVCYVKDKEGDENFNLYCVDPSAQPADGADAPPSRDLTGLQGVVVQLYAAPKTDPDVVFIGINDRDKAWHDLYRVRISTGERTLLRENTDRIAGWEFDLEGNLRMAERSADNGDTEVLRVDAGGFSLVYSCNVFEHCGLIRFHKDGKHVYMETNKGDALDRTELALFDPETGKIETVESDPLQRLDFGTAAFSEATDELIYTVYRDDPNRRYFRDPSYAADFQFLDAQLPGKQLSVPSKTADEQLWLVTATSDVEPGETYLYDRNAKTLTLQYRIREKLPRNALASMQVIRYPSSDGLEIPAYLTLPNGVPPKNLPALVVPHGGPWARDAWGYNPMAQFFANRGYAVLMPNFRSSTGYGKKFLNAGNGEWGRKMQDDITCGVNYLIAQGTADPKRIGILGGSYGGYATLAGVTFTPDLYRAAVDIVGPSNLLTLLDSIPPYWEAGRKMMYARMADPNTAEGKAWLHERSPLNSADRITTPLLVVQGANDPRVNRAEAEQIVVALRDRGFAVEYMLAPDEGHGFRRPVNNMAMFMASEKFLAGQLGGRYQEGGTPEVVQRLSELMVDPKTVTITKKVDPSAVGLPTPVSDLQPGAYNYLAKVELGPQQITIAITTTIQEENGVWLVTNEQSSPMGVATETLRVEKGTLIPLKRSLSQAQMSLSLEYAGGNVTGSMNMNGQANPISVDAGGPLFPEATSLPQAFAALPLAEGYTTMFRNFDAMTQKAKLLQLKVAAAESVTVAAGTFQAHKVEITSAEGGPERATIWITQDTRQPVKLETVLVAAGGAQLTSELQ